MPSPPRPPGADSELATSPSTSTSASAPAPERFEDILGRLRGLIERLEGGNLPLEESLRAFEEGMELCKRGSVILDGAEKKVEMLLGHAPGGPGAPQTTPFQMPEE
jgi:exodeoxyribonuclease VII small subunit